MSPIFGRGDLRLYLLHLLDEGPRHGYEVIRLLEDQFVGLYSPSAGTIYPRLSALEDEGLVEHDEEEGRKVYRITDKGREELHRREDEMAALEARVAKSARDLAREIRDDVRASVRDLRREIKDTARETRGGARDVAREARDVAREVRDVARGVARDVARDVRREERRVHREHRRVEWGDWTVHENWRDELRSLRADLEAFVTDVVAAARRRDLDSDRMRRLRRVLLDARASIIDALSDHPTSPPPTDDK
jgi:DNA-binding PadR family transcriptional regulator